MLAVEHNGPLMVMRINHGKVNAFDLDLIRAIALQVQDLGTAKGVVITGTDRIFSAGVDLTRLLENDLDYTRAFVTELDSLVHTLFELPVPVVAALTGHTIAGGACLLAAACDYRVMAQGRIGVTELSSACLCRLRVWRHCVSPPVPARQGSYCQGGR